jgi:hypothetical protein
MKQLGLSDQEFDKIVESEIKKKKDLHTNDVKYAKEDLARSVLRLMELKERANRMKLES